MIFLNQRDMGRGVWRDDLINGLGAILGAVITVGMMGTALWTGGFYLFTAVLFFALVRVCIPYRATCDRRFL